MVKTRTALLLVACTIIFPQSVTGASEDEFPATMLVDASAVLNLMSELPEKSKLPPTVLIELANHWHQEIELETLPFKRRADCDLYGDVNQDGRVGIRDLFLVLRSLRSRCGWWRYNPRADLVEDCVINWRDILAVVHNFRKRCPKVTPTPEPTSAATNTPSPEPTETQTPDPTATPTPASTDTPTNTETAVPTATDTATNTNTPAPTSTSTPEPTRTSTPTFTETPVPTATNTATNTHTPVPTSANTPEPTSTSTPTNTDTPIPTATDTATHTNTPVPTSTNTPEPTSTFTHTNTETPIPTATDTATHTNTPVPTSTNTPEPTSTFTHTNTATPTPTETFTHTFTNTPTVTPTETPAGIFQPGDAIIDFSVFPDGSPIDGEAIGSAPGTRLVDDFASVGVRFRSTWSPFNTPMTGIGIGVLGGTGGGDDGEGDNYVVGLTIPPPGRIDNRVVWEVQFIEPVLRAGIERRDLLNYALADAVTNFYAADGSLITSIVTTEDLVFVEHEVQPGDPGISRIEITSTAPAIPVNAGAGGGDNLIFSQVGSYPIPPALEYNP